MFTGIIQAVGQIQALQPLSGDLRLHILARGLEMAHVRLGDSIAVNGVCLTVTHLTGSGFWADVSNDTLEHTCLREYQVGMKVNLEPALTLSTPLGGHLVSGHVDGVGVVRERFDDARSVRFWIDAPSQLHKYIALKGSIAVDGVSLTVTGLDQQGFLLNIVPHTVAQTLIQAYRPGTRVHLEVDLLARYLERLLGNASSQPSSNAPALSLERILASGLVRRRQGGS